VDLLTIYRDLDELWEGAAHFHYDCGVFFLHYSVILRQPAWQILGTYLSHTTTYYWSATASSKRRFPRSTLTVLHVGSSDSGLR